MRNKNVLPSLNICKVLFASQAHKRFRSRDGLRQPLGGMGKEDWKPVFCPWAARAMAPAIIR
jgi:hypothetical protein